MGIVNKAGAMYMATGIDNTGLYKGKREAMGIIKAMAGEVTSFDVFGGIGISAAVTFAKAAKDAYTFEKDFQKSMYEVASISNTIKGSLTDYMNSIMEMTRQIPVAANDSAKALYQIVSAGHDGANAMEILEVSAKAAVGGVTDTATAADAITTVLNAYKMSASEAGKVSDMLFMTAKLGKTTMGELGQTIAQAAPIAASYGVGIDQVLSAVASLTKQGTPTAQAMTQIRASILGVSKVLGDGAFDGRTYQEALAEVANHANGSESKLRKLVPEVEAVNAVLGMTGNNATAAAADLGQLQNSLGASETAFKTMQESADNQLQLLQNNIIATLRPLGEGILKEVSEAAQKMNDAFSNGDMENSLQTLETLIKLVSVAFVAYKANAIGAALATSVQVTATNLLNNVKSAYNTVSGAGLVAKEKERVSQLAYIASLEKTLNAEQRAKLSKMDLKAGTKEYVAAITELKEKEKDVADKQVSALGKETSAAEKSMVVAKERAASSSVLVEARKQELAALTSTVQAEKMATAQKELAGATDKQRMTRENAIALNRQKIAAQQAIIAAKESGQSAVKIAALEREIQAINKKVVTAKTDYATATQAVTAKQVEITSINRGVTSKQIETATKKLNTAVEKENTASIAANAAMKDFYSKKSAVAIASTKAGTIATVLSSAQQRANAAATSFSATAHNFLAAAKMKAALATKALTVAIAANPIGALLTVASLAASAIMMLGKNTSDTASIQERFNKSLEEQKKQLDELKSKTEEYLEIIRSETSTQYDKEKALDSLQKMMPTIFKNMDIEKLKLMDILSLNKQIAEEINRRERIGAQTNLIMATNKYNKAAAEYKRKTDMNLTAVNALSDKNDAFLEMELAQKQYDKILNIQKKAEESLKPKELKIVSLQSNIDTLKAEISEMQLLVDKEKEETGGWSSNSAILDAKRGQLSTKEKEMAVLNPVIVKKTKTVIPLTEDEKREAEKRKNTLEDITKTVLGVELKLQQERVNIMADGREKALSEIEVDKKTRLQAIDDEERELKKKYASVGQSMPSDQSANFTRQREAVNTDARYQSASVNKDYDQKEIDFQKELTSVCLTEEEKRKQTIQDRYDAMRRSQQDAYDGELKNIKEQNKVKTLTDEQALDATIKATTKYADIFSQIDNAQVTDEVKSNKEKRDSFIAQLDDYKSREYTLSKEWDERIADAATTGDTGLIESMKAGKKKALNELNAQMLQQSNEWVKLFGNMDDLTISEIEKLVKTIKEKAKDMKLDPVNLDAVFKNLEKAEETIRMRNPFESLADSIKKYKEAEGDAARKNALKDIFKDTYTSLQMIQGCFDAVVEGLTKMGLAGDEETQKLLGGISEMVGSTGKLAEGIATMNPVAMIEGGIGLITAAFDVFDSRSRRANRDIKKHADNLKNLQQQYKELERMTNKGIGDDKYKGQIEQAKNYQAQIGEIQGMISAEQSKKSKKRDQGKIDEWQNQIFELKGNIEDIKKGIIDDLSTTDLYSYANSLASSIVDGFCDGIDDTSGIIDGKMKELMRNIISKQFDVMIIQKAMKPMFDAMEKGFDIESENGFGLSDKEMDAIVSAGEQGKEKIGSSLDGLNETLERLGLLNEEADALKDGVTGKLQAAMTEGTASQLVGLWNMTALDTRALKELTAAHFQQAKPYMLNVESILEETRNINANTLRTANNTDNLIDELQNGFKAMDGRLKSIESNTKSYNGRG